MGTRGFIGFVVDGTEKIAYNHFDSYPDGLGKDVLSWLTATHSSTGEPVDLARALRVVPPDSEPTDEDIARLAPFTNRGVGERRDRPDWYQLLRETQGDPAAMLRAGVIEDAGQFPTDSLFAEWGYVVDFDAGVFEAYRGFQRATHDKGRFAARPGAKGGYFPCALVASWPLSALPAKADFLAALEESEDDS